MQSLLLLHPLGLGLLGWLLGFAICRIGLSAPFCPVWRKGAGLPIFSPSIAHDRGDPGAKHSSRFDL
ncbi:MAG: hypothetical protein MUF72_13895 [Elainella sp. Prado103]|jgi:hypothetical protein|nr:hypothetical protein [Elainella sp. Prado103]